MKYVIIGTAGHVDHGKSALIKSLTGTDTDRLKEEKQRGISIDLGFASLALDEKTMAGIVDVPGHERFLKNMLAGTGGIDIAMLVVAADEGVMPQTQEHLAMLHLYGVRHGLVVINKIDKVEPDWLELVEEEVRTALQGTFLAEAEFCRVSAITGVGLEELKGRLRQLTAEVPARDRMAPYRLWIDRVFSAKGHGVVVTGSALSGTIRTGEVLTLYPSGATVRVRGLESHGIKTVAVYAGQRAALNLAGVEQDEVARGMFLSVADRGEVSDTWDMRITWHEDVPSGTRVRLHLGTGEYLGRLYKFKDTDSTYMRLLLEEPMAAAAGDKGILRLYSPQKLLGGIVLVGVSRKSRKMGEARQALAQSLIQGNTAEIIGRILAHEGMLTAGEIRRKAGYIPDMTLDKSLGKLVSGGMVKALGGYYIDAEELAVITKRVKDQLAKFHKEKADKPGMSKEIVKQQTGIADKAFEEILAYWNEHAGIVVLGADLALKAHAAQHQGWKDDLHAKAEHAFADIGLVHIDAALVGEKLSLSGQNGRIAYDALMKSGQLIKVGDIVVYRKTIQYIAKVIHSYFKDKTTITVAELRDLLNTSRKVALPLMEYLDLHKYTVRDGDMRRLGPKLRDFSE